jgi:hypothetical protein
MELGHVSVSSSANVELVGRDTFAFSTESLLLGNVDLYNVSSVSDSPLLKEPVLRGLRFDFEVLSEDPNFGISIRSPNALIKANTSSNSYISQQTSANVPQLDFSGNASSGASLLSDLDYFIALALPGYEHFRFSVSDSNSTGDSFAEIAFLETESKPIVSTLVGSVEGFADGLRSLGLLSRPRYVTFIDKPLEILCFS